ncbi:sensor histidine kinase [Nocardioides acrostichi]|uniref:Sensor-like histidine kinase SenX3 n=1 Tax=Nocardioides acrostichi TaxID=2784339 RepID=A0A930UYU7_9ACTN|nr:GAF domain-containing sensor histidine kinase [Nocardioides acrostichi]MBF4160530.1 GAF domain-containing sensor histidine kinase [Nocardioides acrostichi]
MDSPVFHRVAAVSTQERARELARYGVIGSAPRPDLVALVELAASVADVPMATINLLTDAEQYQVATVGFEASVCSLDDSMCSVSVEESEPVVVPDATRDPRFAQNPFVDGRIGDVRFYGGHQLRTPSGVVVGTLCVFDSEPRELDEHARRHLRVLADRVVDVLELELRSRQLTRTIDELEGVATELRRSNDELAAFAGQVSHDVRNPLAAIRMSLDLILEDAEDAEDRSLDPGSMLVGVRRASRATDRLQRIVVDLLDFARAGGQQDPVPVDLAVLVADVRSDLEVALKEASVDVGELPVVVGEPARLWAIVQNLLTNAAKFTRDGEPARIEVRAEHQSEVGRWRISVIDHGRGIPAEARERVFLPLTRLSSDVEGSGIGLATVRRIVEGAGGRVGIEETPGGGTTLWFEMPAVPPSP